MTKPVPSTQPCSASPTWDEAERLAALERYAILDTGRETAFDDVAALAADILDAPIAVVNLIAADRQWFKAEVGIGTDTLPLDVSICRHAILQPGVSVVRDLTRDGRFDGNPLVHVTEGLRFYAGALLETPEGLPLGTVCVLDTKPRPEGISERQERALRVLASQTMARLELRRSEAMAQAERARAETHARRLSVVAEASTRLLAADDPTAAVRDLFSLVSKEFRLDVGFHYRCGDGALRLVAAAGLTPAQERAAAQIEFGETVCGIVAARREAAHITGIQTSGDPHVAFLKMLGLDTYFSAPLLAGGDLLGTVSFGRKGEPFSSGELEALRTVVAQLATALERQHAETAVRESEARYRQIVEGAEDFAIVTLDKHGIITAWNSGAAQIVGFSALEAIGQPGAIFFTPEDREAGTVDHEMNRATSDGRAVNERWHLKKDGTRFWGSGLMMRLDEDGGGYLKIFRDRTAEHEREVRQGALADLGDAFRDLSDPADIAFAAAEVLGRTLGVDRVGYATIDHDAETLHVDRDWSAPGVETLAGVFPLRNYNSIIDSLKRGELIAIGDVRNDTRIAGTAANALEGKHARSFVNVPIVEQGRLVAVFFVNHAEARNWSEGDLTLIEEFANRTRTAVERARGERALRESEARFRALVTVGSSSVYWMSPDWREMRRLDGAGFLVDSEEPTTDWVSAYIPPDERPRVHDAIERAITSRSSFELEHRVLRADGTVGWTLSKAVPLLDEAGEIVEWFGAASDVTERVNAGQSFNRLFQASPAPFLVLAPDAPRFEIREVNDAYLAATMTTREGLVGRGVFEAFPDNPDDPTIKGVSTLRASLERVLATRVPDTLPGLKYDIARPDGGFEERWWSPVNSAVVNERGEVEALIHNANDVTDQRRAEAALRASEARLRELNETLERRVAEALSERRLLADVIDGTDVFVQVADRDFNWLAINQAAADEFARIFGVRRPRAGDNMLEMLKHRPDDRAAVEAVWARALGGEEFDAIDEFGDASIDRRYYEMRYRTLRDFEGQTIGAYQFVSDVTDRLREQNRLREAEEALRQSQKMEAMGQLTGGVAHDFNNLLTPIVGSLDMLVRRGVGSERERRLIDGALQSAERAKTLVQRLLAFARRQPLQPVSVDIPKLVNGMVGLIGSTLGPTIDVRVDISPDLPPAKADLNQLEMALLNLAVNARDAMPKGGELTIQAKRESVRRGHAVGLQPGHYVLLCVVDTGMGMDEATRQRAIEPFFSTKGVGKGTGLGLSMVHGLTAQLGGGMKIRSTPGEGTAIELWLPMSTAPIGNEETAPTAPEAPVGRGVALLVDDEELVRMSTADMLIDLGFEVVEARSAEDALNLLNTGTTPNLLVTDHLMPGMSGVDLARKARAMKPTLPVLIVSGYAEVDGIAPDLPRLTKPFRNSELAASVAGLIPLAER